MHKRPFRPRPPSRLLPSPSSPYIVQTMQPYGANYRTWMSPLSRFLQIRGLEALLALHLVT